MKESLSERALKRYKAEFERAQEIIREQYEEIERQEIEIEDLRCTIVDLETKSGSSPATITIRITLE